LNDEGNGSPSKFLAVLQEYGHKYPYQVVLSVMQKSPYESTCGIFHLIARISSYMTLQHVFSIQLGIEALKLFWG
jgi:hypothetical protein